MIHITVIFNSSRQVTWKKTVTGSGAKCNGNAKFLSIDLHQVRIQDYSKGGGASASEAESYQCSEAKS